MNRLLIIALLLITACSREQDPQQRSKIAETSLLKQNETHELFNSNLIPTDNGFIDLHNRTKTELMGEFKNTRPLDTKLTISHDLVDFGLVNGSQVVGYRLSVKNIGVDEALNIKLSPDQNFMVGSDRCSGLNLRTEEVCTFRILFTGKEKTDGEYKGKVSVFAEGDVAVSTQLQATVGESKSLRLESIQGLDINFADRRDQEVVRNIRIVNRGPGVAERILVKTYSGEFKLLANGCAGASLAKNQYCTLSVSYDPKKNNTGRATHSKLTVIPQDYVKNSLEINLHTTLSQMITIKEEIKEQDKSNKPVVQEESKQVEPPKLQAPNLAYNTQKLKKLNKKVDRELKKNQQQALAAEKLLQAELLKEQELEAKRQAELKAQELAAQIAAEKAKAQAEAEKNKQERLEKERLAKEELARQKQLLAEQAKREEELKAKKLAEEKAALELAKEHQRELERQKKLAEAEQKELLAKQKQAELDRKKAEAEALKLKTEQELALQKQKEQEKLVAEAKLKAEQAAKLKLEKEEQEKARLAKLQAEAEQRKAQLEAEESQKLALAAEQAKQKALLEEKRLQEEKRMAEQKAQAEAKVLAEKQAQEKRMAEQKAQAEAKVLAEKQAQEKLMAEQEAKRQAELKAQEEAKAQAEQLALKQRLEAEKEQLRREAEQLAILKKQQEEERLQAEAERVYLAKMEQERIQKEEQEAKAAEELRLAQEEGERRAQIRIQQAEMERVAKEQELLAQQQAEEQRAWVTYQQQTAQKESAKTVSTLVITNSLNTVAQNYKPQIKEVTEDSRTGNSQTVVTKSESGTVVVPEENGTVLMEGSGPLTSLEVKTSTPMEVSWFKGLTAYNLYQRIVPNQTQLMPIQVNPAQLVEGRIVNQRSLVNLSNAQPLTNSDATDLEREIRLEIKATGTFDRCNFSGFFSYLKCMAGTVSLMVKDLIHADKNLEVASGNLVSNEVSISKYVISQVSQYLIPTSSTLPSQAVYRGELYFQAKLMENQSKLFKISGLNIFQVSNLNPGRDDAPWKLVVHNSELYFAALDQNGFAKLFKTNGNQIVQLSNIFPQGNDYLTPAIVFNGELYLEGMNADGFLKLFKTDGKTITQVSDTNPVGSDAPSDFMVYNSELYFRSQNMQGLTKLFKLNGEGIFQVSDINAGQHDAPEFLQAFQGYLYFSAFVENVGNKLFRTNGQVVEQVLSINPGNDEPSDLLVYNNELYFVAVNPEGYRKLYKTNGTEASQVSNIKIGGSDFALDYRNKKSFLTIYNNELYFVAKNQNNGFKIFKTNGQLISQVSNINEVSPELNPTGSDFPFNLIVYSNELYFSAYGNTSGLKLFKLSSESTRRLR